MESNIERNVIIPEIPPGTLEIKYEDWYKNVKNPPSQSDYNYEEFWALQERLCKEGCVTGGVFFNPYLYWHLNFWKTEVDYLDEHGKPQQSYRNPNLRDNEWQVFNGIWQAEKEQKGIPIGGIRRAGKDLLNSSKLWTPTGSKQIGDAKVGDVIFDRNGELTTILEVAPQGVRPVYKMTLQDGRELFCGLDHNWIVLDGGIEKVRTTSELIRGFQKEKYKIPTTQAVKYKYNPNARNPYKYGKNKIIGRIPEKYKISSITQRQWLLRGILEANNVTDYFKHIDIEFKCEVLARDVAEVYRSMGLDVVFSGGCIVRLDCTNRDSYIESIEYVFDAETTCIMVDNKGRDFLTDHYTVTHNSVFEASYIGHGATFDQDSQNIIAGINAADIKLITDKIDKGLNNLPDYFKWQRIEENWTKAVSFGIRAKDNSKFVFSQILIRNLDDGNNEEAIAGTKPRKLIIDESLWEEELVHLEDRSIPIRDVQVGDEIYDDRGQLTKVLEKINPGIVPCYKMTLSDGREVVSSGNHLWRVWNTYLKREVTVTTDELRRKYYFEKTDNRYSKKYKSFIYSIPLSKCIDRHTSDLPVDPYYLGLFLGDGISSNPNIVCTMDQEIVDYISDYAKTLGLLHTERFDSSGEKDHRFRYVTIFSGKGKKNPLLEKMRYLGLSNNKHIPDCYLKSSKDHRLELLRGILDTDGTIQIGGYVEINSSIPNLAEDIVELARSLGFWVSCKIQESYYVKDGLRVKCKDAYRIIIKTDEDIFKLDRKKSRRFKYVGNRNEKKRLHNTKYSTIVGIEYVGDRQCYCIRVDNESKLFLTTDYVVTHNCAKGRFIRALQAAIPGFTTPYGWTCSPVCTFTGGDAKVFHDAQELMMNPEAYNFLSFPHKNKPDVRHGLFIDMTYRLEAKEDSTLAEYLGQPKNKELQKIKMQVGNPDKARKVTEEIIEQRRLSGDRDAYLKERMYYPIEVEDVFLTSGTSTFNTEAIKHQIQFIKDKNIKGNYIELYHDGTGIKSRPSDKKPVPAYPTPKGCDTDAPIVMWEPPIADNKFALYVAGVDSYHKDGQTEHSDSLGAVYIYKRIYNITGDGFQDMLVASYVSRPESKAVWNEQARLLIKYYNAYTLVENDEISFIDYMKQRNDAIKYLAPQPAWLKAVTKYSSQNQDFGVSRSSDKVQNFLESLTASYLDEVVHQEKDAEGSVISEVLGVSRIYDIPLLQELLTYEKGKNADRYVAFSLALAQANDLNPVMNPKSEGESNPLIQGIISRAKDRSSLFSRSGQSILNTTKRRR